MSQKEKNARTAIQGPTDEDLIEEGVQRYKRIKQETCLSLIRASTFPTDRASIEMVEDILKYFKDSI